MRLAVVLAMSKLILVVDGTRARWFRLERRRLIERGDLICPEHKLLDRDRYTETKTGRWERGRLGPTHSFDDHRDAHDREVERRFAHEIADATEQARRELSFEDLVVVGDNRILGVLRPALGPLLAHGPQLIEIRKNVAQWTPDEIHDALVDTGVLEPRPRFLP